MSPNSKVPDSDALSAQGPDRKQRWAISPDAAPRAAQGFGDTAWLRWRPSPSRRPPPTRWHTRKGLAARALRRPQPSAPVALHLQPPRTLCRFAACGMAPGTSRIRSAVASRQGLAARLSGTGLQPFVFHECAIATTRSCTPCFTAKPCGRCHGPPVPARPVRTWCATQRRCGDDAPVLSLYSLIRLPESSVRVGLAVLRVGLAA